MQNFKTRTYHEKIINNMSWKTLVCLQKEWKYDITHFFKKCHNNLEYNVSQGTSSQECVLGKKNGAIPSVWQCFFIKYGDHKK